MKYTDIPEQYKKIRDSVCEAVACDEELIAVITDSHFNNTQITAITKSETGVFTIFQTFKNYDGCNAVYIDSAAIGAIKKAVK